MTNLASISPDIDTVRGHGRRSMYVAGCRCSQCREANRAWNAAWRRRRLYGQEPGLVDAQPAREHVLGLMAQGMGWKTIAKAAGISTSVVSNLLYGRLRGDRREPPTKRLQPATARRLLGVELVVAGGAVVDATGTIRRLQALVAAGLTQQEIADRLGMVPSNLGRIINARTATVTAATRAQVVALYDQCWHPDAPNPRAIRHARTKGWVPPLAWDDESIDDPAAVPQGMGPAGARCTREEVAWRRVLGEPLDQIARDLGVRPDSLERSLTRRRAAA